MEQDRHKTKLFCRNLTISWSNCRRLWTRKKDSQSFSFKMSMAWFLLWQLCFSKKWKSSMHFSMRWGKAWWILTWQWKAWLERVWLMIQCISVSKTIKSQTTGVQSAILHSSLFHHGFKILLKELNSQITGWEMVTPTHIGCRECSSLMDSSQVFCKLMPDILRLLSII